MVSTRRQLQALETKEHPVDDSEQPTSLEKQNDDLPNAGDTDGLKKKDQSSVPSKEVKVTSSGRSEKDEESSSSSDGARREENELSQTGQHVVQENTQRESPKKSSSSKFIITKELKTGEKNVLTKLIHGYTAPMKLNASSLDRYRPAGGIKDLQKRAERTDASTRNFVIEATKPHTDAMKKVSNNGLFSASYTSAYASFKKGVKRAPDTTAGKGWFGMTPTPMTDELKTDLAVIRNRNYLDPKKFYKSADASHKVVQVGTVIEGASEFYSSRLTKKQRRSNLTEEIMADPSSADYARQKFLEMSREKTNQAKKRARIHKPKRGKRFF